MMQETFLYKWLVQLNFCGKLLKGELSNVGNFKGFESQWKTDFPKSYTKQPCVLSCG